MWESSLAVIAALQMQPTLIAGKRVLELGAGACSVPHDWRAAERARKSLRRDTETHAVAQVQGWCPLPARCWVRAASLRRTGTSR